jgi:hypothetical protein
MLLMLLEPLRLSAGISLSIRGRRKRTQEVIEKPHERVEDEEKYNIRPAEDARQHRAHGKEEGGSEPEKQRPLRSSARQGKDGQEQRRPPGEVAQMPPGRAPIKGRDLHRELRPHGAAFDLRADQVKQ